MAGRAAANSAPDDAAPDNSRPREGRRLPGNDHRGNWREIERAWLGLRAVAFGEDVGSWRPDVFGTWCQGCGRTLGGEAGPNSRRDGIDDDATPWDTHDEHAATPDGPLVAARPSCSVCAGARPPWQRVVRLGEHTGELRRAIHELKFDRWRRSGEALGRALGVQLAHAAEGRRLVLVPVPMSWRRWMARGVDHTLVLAQAAARAARGTGCPARVMRALRRMHRPSQLEVAPSRRQANVATSFRVRDPLWTRCLGLIYQQPQSIVVVIDDVLTSGSTMRAACRTLIRRTSTTQAHPRHESPASPELWAGVAAVADHR